MLETFQNRCLWRILGVFWPNKITKLLIKSCFYRIHIGGHTDQEEKMEKAWAHYRTALRWMEEGDVVDRKKLIRETFIKLHAVDRSLKPNLIFLFASLYGRAVISNPYNDRSFFDERRSHDDSFLKNQQSIFNIENDASTSFEATPFICCVICNAGIQQNMIQLNSAQLNTRTA